MWRAGYIYWIVQLVGWGGFCALIGFTQYAQGEFDLATFYQLLYLFLFFILTTHAMRFVLIRFDWLNLKLTPLIPRLFGLNILAATVLYSMTYLFTELFFPSDDESFSVFGFIINIFLYSIFFILWSAVYLAYHLINKSRHQELRNLQLEATNNEIELKTLRDQLNPHFLFNSLNSIRALVEEDPKLAKSAITTLSNLLRRSLNMGKKPQVTLEEELNLVKEYLELEKIRFEERLQLRIQVDANPNLFIPPFIIQTLAENAIKHGIGKQTSGGIVRIEVIETAEQLSILIENPGELKPSNGNGIGVENTRRRLSIQYGDAAKLKLQAANNLVRVSITIQKTALNQTI